MYTIYSPHKNHLLTGDSLEDLRKQLVDWHEENRLDPQYGDFQDQFEAVYPLDDSELDEGEDESVQREVLTMELLQDFAKYVWDTSAVYVIPM